MPNEKSEVFGLHSFFCGAGGSRTLVQTRNNHAFYILILLLFFELCKETDILIATLSPKASRRCRSFRVAIPKLLSTSLPDRNREAPSARCLVLSPCERMKLVYYTSTKQRERMYFRQLIFCSQDLRASLRGSVCLHNPSTSCQNRSAPDYVDFD